MFSGPLKESYKEALEATRARARACVRACVCASTPWLSLAAQVTLDMRTNNSPRGHFFRRPEVAVVPEGGFWPALPLLSISVVKSVDNKKSSGMIPVGFN